ncbi:hypothetical protein EDEG_02994 [Edhazardia aedis USNM 41457]|uniref:ADP,ATP carrier protein n=1 Tax=Edhazardia aedis (strain USNM 41457) TaxID=1003232 RepID=J9DMP0_EDHAE|nr:hypothetical protein EDEG_02994 [Edhazardia aedis USNM 41457]|eukprot:EJW02597.1 hypothetical protein EDEG_02994 [Edhazardia aedis USNM 41457]
MQEVDPGYSRLPTEDEVDEEAKHRVEWYGAFFKVAKCEFSKIWRMCLMFGLVAYIYSVLRVVKDAIVSERQIPASIQFLKLTLVTPCSIFSVIIVTYLLGRMSIGNVLKICVLFFGVFFLVYGLTMNFHHFVEKNEYWAINKLGDGKCSFRGLASLYPVFLCINFWTSSLLYLFSELWGSVVLSLLCLSYFNHICTFKQSLRFVPILYIMSNVGLLMSSLTMFGIAALKNHASYFINTHAISVLLIVSAFITISIYFVQKSLETSVLPIPIFQVTSTATKKKAKKKIGFVEGVAEMIKSKLLINMSFIVLAYNVRQIFLNVSTSRV